MKKFFTILALATLAIGLTGSCDKEEKSPEKETGRSQSCEKESDDGWFPSLPDNTKLIDMTIPGLHDAATWAFDGSHPFAPGFKDQAIPYCDAYSLGARAFDLRIGFDDNLCFSDNFGDFCRFFHGVMDIMATFNLSQMNKIGSDIALFPSPLQLKNDFMILFVQWEYPRNSELQKSVFHYLMKQLVARYGEGSFIAYNPNLTKKDLTGRILVIAQNEEFLRHYEAGSMPPVPMSYYNKNEHTIQAFIGNTLVGEKYPVYEVNNWELESGTWQEKWDGDIKTYFSADRPGDRMQILYANAIIPNLSNMFGGWEVCPHINADLALYLKNNPQSSGIVMMDFFGKNEMDGHNFHGKDLGDALINCN